MRRLVAIALAGALVLALLAAGERRAAAQTGGSFGLGLIVGEPTGVSGKLYIKRTHAIDGAIGLGFADGRGIHVHADYLWHPLVLTQTPSFDLPLYVGLGGRLQSHGKRDDRDDHLALGPRFVAGILFGFRTAPIDVFLEFALGIDLVAGDDTPRSGLTIDLAAGVRYYF
jgi:hypothetical protein